MKKHFVCWHSCSACSRQAAAQLLSVSCPRRPQQKIPPPYTTQELYGERDGNRIYGVLYRPQDAGEKLPAIIFSHGFSGTYRVGVPYAQALAEKGYAVYCFDFCGGSYSSQSDGSPLDMSLRTEQADLEAVIRMVQELDFIDADNLFLMGTSQGGAVSAVTAADHPNEIRGLIVLYPAFIMAERANELFQSEEEISDTYYFMWMEVGHEYFASLLGYDLCGHRGLRQGRAAAPRRRGYHRPLFRFRACARGLSFRIARSPAGRRTRLFRRGRKHGNSSDCRLSAVPFGLMKEGMLMRKATVAACIAALMLALLAACGAAETTTTQTPAPGDTILESAEGRVVKMTAGETEIYITLNNSQAAATLAQMLPLETELIERAYFAKGMLLPAPLPDTEQTTREYAVGDLGYWADGQNLAIFYDDWMPQTSVPVIPLGHADSGAEQLDGVTGTATLELMPDDADESQLTDHN